MVDPDRVRAKLTALAGFRQSLQELAEVDPATYQAAHLYEGRYLVQAAAQACIDLAHHVIASEGWAPTTEYRQAFTRLAQHEIIDDELAARLQDLTGLRNRLVHLYDDVDDQLVQDAIIEGLPDLDAFAASIARLVIHDGR